PEFSKAMAAMQQRFTDELLKEIVPTVEKNFRVRDGAENRALAGLSMGGGQTLSAVVSSPDKFGYVGIWSAGIFGDAAEWETGSGVAWGLAVARPHPTRITDSMRPRMARRFSKVLLSFGPRSGSLRMPSRAFVPTIQDHREKSHDHSTHEHFAPRLRHERRCG